MRGLALGFFSPNPDPLTRINGECFSDLILSLSVRTLLFSIYIHYCLVLTIPRGRALEAPVFHEALEAVSDPGRSGGYKMIQIHCVRLLGTT